MIVYDKEQKEIVIPNGLGNVNIIINQGCDDDKPTPPEDGWGMTGYFNNWGGTPDIPFEEDGEWDGRPYKVIRGFEAVQGEFKIRRNNAWTSSYTAYLTNEPQFAKLQKGDWNMPIDDGVWDIYLFFGDDGVPNEMLILHSGTDLSTIQYEYTLNLSADKESAIFHIGDGFDFSDKKYYGGSATIPMKYGCTYNINVYMEGYEDIYDEITCYNDEERTYTLTKIEGGNCNLINPIVFSKEAGNTINAENVQIPTFVYEGNQYYNVDSFNLADIEEFKIHILFKPNNIGDTEPINIFGCEDTDWDNTTFGARIYQGLIYFRMNGEDVSYIYNESAWYDVEMGYNTTKRWVIVNKETLLDAEYASFNKPSQTLMIGAINSGGNAFRPFYGKIAAIYIESNGNQVWLLPIEDGTMGVYWNNRTNRRNSISGDNNARFENDYISGDGMKSITWLGNLEDKWVTPSMSERDDNGYIVVSPSEGYNGLKRTVINPQTLYNEGIEEGRADVAAKARVLNVTENGSYVSKYTEEGEIVMPFDLWGDDFYSYAYVKNKIYNTGIIPNENTRLEFWFKPDESDYMGGNSIVIMNNANSVYGNTFGIFHRTAGDQSYYANIGGNEVNFRLTNGVLYHIVLSVADGLVINGEQIGTFSSSSNFSEPLYINGMSNDLNASADGEFGMIKIDNTIIIPTKNGFLNQNTNELLEVVYDGGVYKFTEISKPTIEGNLYRTINVNVIPKINVKEAGFRFGFSTFTEVPEWAGFEGITNMSNMFYRCLHLQTIPQIDTSNVTDMNNMFYNCISLQTIPLIDTSKVTDMHYMFYACQNLQTMPQIDTSNVINMEEMLYGCSNNLQTIPPLNTSKVSNMTDMLGGCYNLTSLPALNAQSLNMPSYLGIFGYTDLPKLTDFGGFLNLKCSLASDNNLKRLPNLTYQSCINILNGLYDFTGNGETPNSEQGQLKVHQNFLDKVGNEISIGTAKGWSITA